MHALQYIQYAVVCDAANGEGQIYTATNVDNWTRSAAEHVSTTNSLKDSVFDGALYRRW